jgi:hypothetical protein
MSRVAAIFPFPVLFSLPPACQRSCGSSPKPALTRETCCE